MRFLILPCGIEQRDVFDQQIIAIHDNGLVFLKDGQPFLRRAAQLLVEASGMDKVFFTNSGAEAVEGAIKAARKYDMRNSKTKEMLF